MRFAFALLLLVATLGFAGAQEKPKNSEEVLRPAAPAQGAVTNKGWDVQLENANNRTWIASRCKGEARKRYSALHPLKRRNFSEGMHRAGGPLTGRHDASIDIQRTFSICESGHPARNSLA